MSVYSVNSVRKPAGIDGKEAWENCVKYGGVNEAARHMINPITGKAYTPSGISRPAYRYALLRLEEIRPQWEQIAYAEGIPQQRKHGRSGYCKKRRWRIITKFPLTKNLLKKTN